MRGALAFLLLAAVAGAAPAAAGEGVTRIDKALCEAGPLFAIPGTPFAVLVFCEGAMGNGLAVVRSSPMGPPSSGAWSREDRIWQSGPWTRDVTSYAPSADGRALFVATSETFGAGGVYRLDLARRTAGRIDPDAGRTRVGRVYAIEGFKEGRLDVSVTLDGQTRHLSVPAR